MNTTVSHPNAISIPPELVDALRAAQHVVALTGAGISAESGVPTFREAQTGLWANYNPEELATPQAFRRNPRLVWEWYTWRRELVNQAEPNPGHLALAKLQKQVPKLTLVTQNVDGLHHRAGSQSIIELHGNVNRTICAAEGTVIDSWAETEEGPPRCPHCDSFLRPDVVWFGENLSSQALQAAFEATEKCDLFLSIGTSALVHPAASLPFVALERGTVTVEINPGSTPLTPHVTHVLPGPAGQVLPELLSQFKGEADGFP